MCVMACAGIRFLIDRWLRTDAVEGLCKHRPGRRSRRDYAQPASAVLGGKAQLVSHADPDQMMRLVFALQPPHLAEEKQFVEDVLTKGNPQFPDTGAMDRARLLKLLVEGHNYKTATVELNLSVNTIRFHMKSIYQKLQVHSKSEAVAKALRQRIVH